MIDLLKNYKELKNAPGYAGSLRYYLAKKKLDVYFLIARHCLSNGSSQIRKLFSNFCKKHNLASLKPSSIFLFIF